MHLPAPSASRDSGLPTDRYHDAAARRASSRTTATPYTRNALDKAG
jgi:hypothetical protein